MPRKKYSTPNIPESMKNHHQKLIDQHPEWGYSSFAEYVRDAMRTKLEILLQQDRKENGDE